MTQPHLRVRLLGRSEYLPVWREMQRFTRTRRPDTPSEVWLLEHPPVFTLGQAGRREHILDPGNIPVVQSDRGGQVTYHGPGQLIAYLMLDLRQAGLGVRGLVSLLEDMIVDLLADYGIRGEGRRDAPGVYVKDRKIASLGLRFSRGYSYHGVSLNVAMDLEPFRRINPCGYAGLEMTQLADLGGPQDLQQIGAGLLVHLGARLGYMVEPT